MNQRRSVVAFVVRWKYFYPLLRLLGAVGIALVLLRFHFHYLEGALYDARVRFSPSPSITGQVVTIAIDPKTVSTFQGEPDTKDNISLLEQLKTESPQAIVYMADPTQWVGSMPEKTKFALTAAQILNFFFTTEQIAPVGKYTQQRLAKPFDNLSLSPAPITRDNITFAGDKVTRRVLLAFEGQLVLQPILANLHNQIVHPAAYRGSFESEGSIFNYIRYRPTGTYKALSFVDVKDGRFPKGYFNNKIVLIGRDTQLDTDDYILTPHSRYPLAMSRLEAQANIIDTLIENNGVARAPTTVDIILSILVAYLTVLIVWGASPIAGIALLFLQAFVFCIFAYSLFAVFGLWIDMIHPLMAIFVSYYFFIPYRLIKENKKSWEYYQKNRLLTQVEELKTNFLSMMSHDLKTPIARIQGMAEMALNDKKNLSQEQNQALKTIMRSSEELGNFIGSILDLSRIESKEVKLQKTSRDINSVVKETIKKYDFNARQKNITLKTELEPLFSLKVDVDLIRQVFSNLIENAIKYSPENSIIKISSKEENGQILVRVTDEGPGIDQDDVDNIFLKFYRSKAAKASPIKGSGLGLYLAKYFIELHNGTINVESQPMKGSTFTVQLPLV
ncbi:MAG: ATP-binding protein [Oligoflexia bacterium]|nr:ATP-binding protein [Oligoflexia bacterium]